MHWALIVPVASVAAGTSSGAAFVAFLASVPFSPARFWAWRLRKQMETVKALDEDRHKAQREVLLQRADFLASKAAATQRIPTPWKRYVIGTALWVFSSVLVVDLFMAARHGELPVGDPTLMFAPIAVIGGFGLAYKSTVVYFRYNVQERARYIDDGCPTDFVTKPTVHERDNAYAQYERERTNKAAARYRSARERAKRLEKAGLMPSNWPPHSRVDCTWRSLRSGVVIRKIVPALWRE